MVQLSNRSLLVVIRLFLSLPLIIVSMFVIAWWPSPPVEWAWLLCGTVIVTVFLTQRARVPKSFTTYQHIDTHVKDVQHQSIHEDVFTIPKVCPVCKTPLRLDEVKWKDQHTLLCQECHSKVDVTVT